MFSVGIVKYLLIGKWMLGEIYSSFIDLLIEKGLILEYNIVW